MSSESYWGTLPPIESIITPEGILREQADKLSEITGGVLSGKLDVRPSSGSHLYVDLDLHAPNLQYFTTIVSLSAGRTLYPVVLSDRTTDHDYTCEDENSFRSALKEVLSSGGTVGLVTGLLARSRSIQD